MVLAMTKRCQHRVLGPFIVAAALAVATGAHAEMTMQQARAHFAGMTRVGHTSGHGTQVSYMDPQGAVFLWYPGNAVVLRGRWKIEAVSTSDEPGASVCFLYGANTFNPVMNQRGGSWNCAPAHQLARTTVDSAEGDVFGLARRTAVPFRLTPEETTIEILRRGARSPKQTRPNAPSRPSPGFAAGEAGFN
jgi:hypothetical protein